ncbi:MULTISPECIES: SDR family oxidoreductase [unclassified Streptomyces]|uniref:SDR family oxidoreductase n=1 Tax=unclassified Streptomyces TaxID=2593676 RepID=UPI00081E2B83|nr:MULTISPECIES: SDR family oxidoreductase [unclassified Streptomyces]MYR95251.1 SDR family oxidoreductase [Streptomyces sp. SID4937]SCD86555.1 Short-chain dehydrogenase [Streptomyces sp. ScaeMP-e83]
MTTRTWFITGVNSGFGRELAEQLLARGDRVAGTVRREGSVDDLRAEYGERFWLGHLDVTDLSRVRSVVNAAFDELGRIDVVVINAGYGLFGAAEEFTDEQVVHQITTNLLGSIQTARAALPHLRAQGGGRIIQLSSVAGLAAHPGASLYHAGKWGVEGFMEALAAEVAPFGVEVTLVEPGGARTAFAGSSLRLSEPLAAYDNTPAAAVRVFKDIAVPVPGDPAKVAAKIIDSASQHPAPMRLVLGTDCYQAATTALRQRLAQIEPQQTGAAETDADT